MRSCDIGIYVVQLVNVTTRMNSHVATNPLMSSVTNQIKSDYVCTART